MYTQLIQKSLENCLDRNRPYVLWDFPNYQNPGDSAIWLGGIKSLKVFFKRNPESVTEAVSEEDLLPQVSLDTQILLNGGGNFGDLWPRFQHFREMIIRKYPNNRIVQMPQSIFFEDPTNYERAKKTCQAHSDLHIMVRDKTSYAKAFDINNGRASLVPDLALAIQLERTKRPKEPIFALLRTDKEKIINSKNKISGEIKFDDWIKGEPQWLEKDILWFLNRVYRRKLFMRSAIVRIKLVIFNRLANRRLNRAINYLSRGKVIISDRLHAHILCCIMKIPHIVLDNSYKKLSLFQACWSTGDPSFCCKASNLEDAIRKARALL